MKYYTLFFNSYGQLTFLYNGPDETEARKTEGVLSESDADTLIHDAGWFELITWENGRPIKEETKNRGTEWFSDGYDKYSQT